MHSPDVLKAIHAEHGRSTCRLAETLLLAGVLVADVELLHRLPWPFLANRVAVERERLGLAAVHPLLHWKLPPPLPAWVTPAVIVKMFDLALSDEDAEDTADSEKSNELALPA